MAGVLSQSAGVLAEPYKPTFADYALAALAGGGLRGVAALALNSRAAQHQYQQQAPILADLQAALKPRESMTFKPGQQTGQGALSMAPIASEDSNGVLSRQLQAAPVLSEVPTAETRQTLPSLAEIAPALLRAQAAGINTSPVTGVLSAMRQEERDNRPSVYSLGGGVLASYDPADQSVNEVYRAPVQRPKAPANYRWTENDELEFIPGGAADPEVIAKNAGVRRDVVVKRPMPSRARSGGTSSAAAAPWKKNWR